MAEVRVEGGKGHQRHGWVLESLVRHQGRPKGTSTGGGDPPRDGNALSEREPNPNLLTAPGRYKPFLLVLTSVSSPFFNLLVGEQKGANKIRG